MDILKLDMLCVGLLLRSERQTLNSGCPPSLRCGACQKHEASGENKHDAGARGKRYGEPVLFFAVCLKRIHKRQARVPSVADCERTRLSTWALPIARR